MKIINFFLKEKLLEAFFSALKTYYKKYIKNQLNKLKEKKNYRYI